MNIPDAFGDRTNLGGGIWLENITHATIQHNVVTSQNNGIDAFFINNSTISNNYASDNVGWGIHIYKSSYNTIENNIADNCIRGNFLFIFRSV